MRSPFNPIKGLVKPEELRGWLIKTAVSKVDIKSYYKFTLGV